MFFGVTASLIGAYVAMVHFHIGTGKASLIVGMSAVVMTVWLFNWWSHEYRGTLKYCVGIFLVGAVAVIYTSHPNEVRFDHLNHIFQYFTPDVLVALLFAVAIAVGLCTTLGGADVGGADD